MNSQMNSKMSSIVTTLLVAAACAAPASAAPVEKRVIAKLYPAEVRVFRGGARGEGYQVASEDGRHVGLVRSVGGRFVVEVDGNKSQVWDEVGGFLTVPDGHNSPRAQLVLSPDGSRHAYVAREGERLVLVVNEQSTPIEPPAMNSAGWFSFSPDGSRYVMVVKAPSKGQAWIVVDGKKLGPYGDVKHVTFSADGKHIAYVVHQSSLENLRAGVKVVFDGKESPAYGRVSDLVMSRDGSRFAYVSEAMYTERPEGFRVVVDGKASAQRYAIVKHLQISANGKRVAFAGTPTDDGASYNKHQLVIDGKAGTAYSFIKELKLSPDGSRYAARVNKPIPGSDVARATYVVDGKETRDYDEVGMHDTIYFTADSKHVAIDGLTYLLIDGKELPGAGNGQGVGVRVGPKGSSLAYRTKEDDNIVRVFVNGKKSPDLGSAEIDSLVFSPDGMDAAYWGTDVSGKSMIFTNDKAFPLPAHRIDGFLVSRSKEKISLLWSPDSQHVATTVDRKLWIDGRVGQQCLFGYLPAFSTDSKHFAVACTEPKSVLEDFAIHVNGQRVVVAEGVFLDPRATLRFSADGMLETYGLFGSELTALRITPDTGGIAQIGSGQAAAKSANAKPGDSKSASAPSAQEQTTEAGQTVPVPAKPNAAEKATEKAKEVLDKLPGIFKKKKKE